jgi:oligopeptidase A
VGEAPALFTHDEVQTLFHEFGHGLQHMLTRIDTAGVAGINGVPWDAVELPSQFMENWCWEREALDLFAAHYQTGEKIPDDLYGKMIAAKNFQAGMQMVRQLEFSLFDFRLHLEYEPEEGGRIQQILDEVRAEVAVVEPPEYNRFQHGFAHIFAGGYAAGYYSYKWAEVLSADAFSRFEEEGIFNQETGLAFLETILEQGGSREPMDLFIEFRGRKPTIDALLRHTGIAA